MFLLQGMLGLTVTSGMVRASVIDIEMFLLQGMLGLTHIWHGQVSIIDIEMFLLQGMLGLTVTSGMVRALLLI